VLPLPVRRGTEAPPPYVEAVGQSEEAVDKQMAAITRGMSGIVERAQQVRGAAGEAGWPLGQLSLKATHLERYKQSAYGHPLGCVTPSLFCPPCSC
jgi:hypothetical protein